MYFPLEDQWMRGELPEEMQKPSSRYYWELQEVHMADELLPWRPLWFSGKWLKDLRFDGTNLSCGSQSFGVFYSDAQWMPLEYLARLDELAQPDDARGGADDDRHAFDADARAQLPVLPLEAGQLQGLAGRDQGVVQGKWLLDEIEGPVLQGRDRGLDVAVAGDHDDRRVHALLAHGHEHAHAVEARHPDVQENEVEVPVQGHVQALRPAAGLGHLPALVLENAAQRRADVLLVVDDEDGCGAHHASLRAAGSSMTKVVPAGSLGLTRM